MDTMTQPKITGYRKLSEAEVALINEGKALAQQVGDYINKLEELLDARESIDVSIRWIHIGRTQLQLGFMALARSVAKPEGF